MTNTLHLPPAVEHAAHEVAHRAEAVTHQVADTAHHLGDAVVDVLLSPLTPELADLHIEVTEDDIL